MGDKYYGIDFGGSNLRIAQVDIHTGELIGYPFVTSLQNVTSNSELNDIIFSKIQKHCGIGISAAGDVDEKELLLKLSPNSNIKGEITFGRDLSDAGNRVEMTNDMKAAVQAAARFGEGRGLGNVLLATYSSGYNCAVSRCEENCTNAEFGHMPYRPKGLNEDMQCGCGGTGHLETYVSGNGAAAMAKLFFNANSINQHPILWFALADYAKKLLLARTDIDSSILDTNQEFRREIVDSITAKHVYLAFRDYPLEEPQKAIQETQVAAIADSFGMMNSAYNPLDIMVLMGSQTKDWDVLFRPAIERYHSEILQMPTFPKPPIVATILPEIGVQGAVAYLLSKQK